MNEKTKYLVETYQCPGCVCGHDTQCYQSNNGIECSKHCVGTMVSSIGKICLGLATGFNRIGPCANMKIYIFDSVEEDHYNKFNVPVWKHLDDHGNTLVRGLSPRINSPFIHIFYGDTRDKINCIEISMKDIEEMD